MSQNILIVAGMHRSGTSALTRAINLAGVPLPSNLVPPGPANTDGFWEPGYIVDLHTRMLLSLTSNWDDYREIPVGWFDGVDARRFGGQLCDWIQTEIGGKSLLLVKDPRICRFLPLWQKICAIVDVQIHTVIAVRNPIEVAASLQARDQFPPLKSALLWLRYFVDAERFTRGRSRCFVDFDDFMRRSLSNIRRIAAELNLVFPVPDSALRPLLDTVLKPSLRHHVETRESLANADDSSSPPMTGYLWALDAVAGRCPPTAVLERIARELKGVEKGREITYASSS